MGSDRRRRRLHHGPLDEDAGGGVPPQGDEELARQGDDGRLAHPPAKAPAVIYATVNTRRETDLRAALAKLKNADEQTARDAGARFAAEHAERCEGPWAARGQARLAEAVQHPARLAGLPPLPAQAADRPGAAHA